VIRAVNPAAAAAVAARLVADACRHAVAERGHALIAVSGGETPGPMLLQLARLDVPWSHVHVAQVDERVVPRDDPRRNLRALERSLVASGALPRAQLHAMPVEADDLDAAPSAYVSILESLAGRPLMFDLVQLGLGTDGHTASLVPGDPALDVVDHDVALTGDYHGLRRMTLTFPALNRARRRLWLVTGETKRRPLAELLADPLDVRRDDGIAPALRVERDATDVVADAAACGDVPEG